MYTMFLCHSFLFQFRLYLPVTVLAYGKYFNSIVANISFIWCRLVFAISLLFLQNILPVLKSLKISCGLDIFHSHSKCAIDDGDDDQVAHVLVYRQNVVLAGLCSLT